MSSLSESSESLRSARVIVTGARGFLGRNLCAQLSAVGAELVVFEREASGHHGDSSNVVHVDLADRAQVSRALQRVNPDLVFHLAGFVSGDRSTGAFARAFEGNVLPSANLLLSCAEHHPRTRVVLTNSLEASNPWQATAQTGSPYGVSKLMVELLAGGMHRLAGSDAVSARIGMAYGPNDPNRQRLVPSVITSLLQGASPQLGSGHRCCDFIHVDDVVAGMFAMATARSLAAAELDLGQGELVSVRKVAEGIHRLLAAAGDVPALRFDETLDRPNEQRRSADVEATFRATGFRPQISLEAGLSRTISWYRAQLTAAASTPSR